MSSLSIKIASLVSSLFLLGMTQTAVAQVETYQRLKQQTILDVRTKVKPILEKYCFDACELINIEVEVDEEIPDGQNMGFENLVPGDSLGKAFVSQIFINIQADERVTTKNKERLEAIIRNYIEEHAAVSQITWRSIRLPDIGRSGVVDQQLKLKLESQLRQTVGRVISRYCPNQCILERIDIEGESVSPEEAGALTASQRISDETGRATFKVNRVDLDLSMDEGIDSEKRQKIANLISTKTRYVEPVNVNVAVIPFPETYSDLREKERMEAEDPYGLEKLRRTLMLFKELAGTKEIITNNNQNTTASTTNNKNERLEIQTNSKQDSNSSEKIVSENSDKLLEKNSNSMTNDNIFGLSSEEMMVYGAIIVLFLALVAIAIIKVIGANKNANDLLLRSPGFADPFERGAQKQNANENGPAVPLEDKEAIRKATALRLKINELKQELIQLFMDSPRVAKDTFGRMLKEDGVEQTSKYVKIFGHMVVFELLGDPNMHRDLFQLSEYFHNTEYAFTEEEELDLLVKLKTRCTASEIRVLTSRVSDKFEFLNRLDPPQVYQLIADEKMQLQSIVLSQLDRKRRMAVFEMYTGRSRVELMSELSLAEAIPKEYLYNVARALQRKVKDSPEFDVENLRTSDILLDLLEKSGIEEQRSLMAELTKNNPDTARAIKQKFVSVDILGYLKDGHLLEVMLGLERQDLMAFLAGVADHIRMLLLRRAPRELAESWMEDLQASARIDEQTYRMAEMKVTGRVRSLANSGAINLVDLNDMIYGTGPQESQSNQMSNQQLSSASMVA